MNADQASVITACTIIQTLILVIWYWTWSFRGMKK